MDYLGCPVTRCFPTTFDAVPGTSTAALRAPDSFSSWFLFLSQSAFALRFARLQFYIESSPDQSVLPGTYRLLNLKHPCTQRHTSVQRGPVYSRSPVGFAAGRRQTGFLLTFVVWQWEMNVTLAKGSESPLLSAAMRPRAWYM